MTDADIDKLADAIVKKMEARKEYKRKCKGINAIMRDGFKVMIFIGYMNKPKSLIDIYEHFWCFDTEYIDILLHWIIKSDLAARKEANDCPAKKDIYYSARGDD